MFTTSRRSVFLGFALPLLAFLVAAGFGFLGVSAKPVDVAASAGELVARNGSCGTCGTCPSYPSVQKALTKKFPDAFAGYRLQLRRSS